MGSSKKDKFQDLDETMTPLEINLIEYPRLSEIEGRFNGDPNAFALRSIRYNYLAPCYWQTGKFESIQLTFRNGMNSPIFGAK